MIMKQNYKNLFNFFKKKQKIPKAVLKNNMREKYSIVNTHKNDVSLIFFLVKIYIENSINRKKV